MVISVCRFGLRWVGNGRFSQQDLYKDECSSGRFSVLLWSYIRPLFCVLLGHQVDKDFEWQHVLKWISGGISTWFFVVFHLFFKVECGIKGFQSQMGLVVGVVSL